MSENRTTTDTADGPRTIESRQHMREQLEADVAAFMADGGEIQHIDPHVTADPPTKPISKYGGRPI